MKIKGCPFCGLNLEWNTDLCGFVHENLEETECPISYLLLDKKDLERWNTRTYDIDELTERFLKCKLPETVCPDLCSMIQGPGRIGTNLLTFSEAKDMLKYVLDNPEKT